MESIQELIELKRSELRARMATAKAELQSLADDDQTVEEHATREKLEGTLEILKTAIAIRERYHAVGEEEWERWTDAQPRDYALWR
jgi:uncharacterized membrane-anchored protein YhcB (DUF1043 family)